MNPPGSACQVETIQKTLTDLVESGDAIERVIKSWKEALCGADVGCSVS